MDEVQAEGQQEPETAVIFTLRPGHADTIARLMVLIEYQNIILTSLSNELRQFLLIAYGVDMATQKVILDKESGEIRLC